MADLTSRLRQRAEFLKVSAEGQKWVTHGLIIQVLRHDKSPLGSAFSEKTDLSSEMPSSAPMAEECVVLEKNSTPVRIGFTASRKVGGSVQRNRARRRLKAIINDIFKLKKPTQSFDLVVIARPATLERDYTTLTQDLLYALKKIGAPLQDA